MRLFYVCLNDPELNVQRVRARVVEGGHNVPDEDVRRRYKRSLLNLPTAIRSVDHAVVYDNSGAESQKMIEVKAGVITWRAQREPSWVSRLIEAMS